MAEKILFFILMIPIYGLVIWSYYDPEESLLFGKRWMYKEEPELSNEVIRYTKFASMVLMIGLPIIVISFLFDIYFLRFALVLIPLVVILGALKIFTDKYNS
ncbi:MULTISPECIES: hypothetical protein [unclassified Lysinibacillus]|uniref:hypothetical protein n=1 Tax=unclassified Lysinibacillus TaxID=2636778 RepID=UPI002556F779|nr:MULTISPECIES: hypothetical protein [unclassified Lysinibacillus]MDM5249571.1 hypothetical protein [Lysinibacillus sp. G4S2]